jgi:hypothetical protein
MALNAFALLKTLWSMLASFKTTHASPSPPTPSATPPQANTQALSSPSSPSRQPNHNALTMEPWSIVASHPVSGDPFGLVIDIDCTMADAEHIAINLLGTFKLTGAYIPSSLVHPKQGQYLLLYRIHPDPHPRMASIWAENLEDAELRLNILAADGILLMPASG